VKKAAARGEGREEREERGAERDAEKVEANGQRSRRAQKKVEVGVR
jgi:hypothetical protein